MGEGFLLSVDQEVGISRCSFRYRFWPPFERFFSRFLAPKSCSIPLRRNSSYQLTRRSGFQDARFTACFGPLFCENFRFLQSFRFAVGFGHLLRDFFKISGAKIMLDPTQKKFLLSVDQEVGISRCP